jgi:3-methyladenine DNA glycosylase Tag
MEIKEEFGSFDNYIWRFVDYRPIANRWKDVKEIPSKSALSGQISEDLIKRGFRFIGSTILYACLLAVGLVNDHIVSCLGTHRSFPSPPNQENKHRAVVGKGKPVQTSCSHSCKPVVCC